MGANREEHLGLRAVVFDYGMVLTGPPDPEAHAMLMRITGLPLEQFESLYWADRHAYDEGKLSGIAFWQKIVKDGNLSLGQDAVEELNRWDARMWTTENPGMVAWQEALKEHGLLTAILSNIGDSVTEAVLREHAWVRRFDVLVWSYQLLMAKPEPAIFRYVLDKLGTRPEETLFIDDRMVNIEAARALGMVAFEFTTAERLRADLIAAGLDAEIPLPA
jgi:putative hydrolase of the HAD superfamily